MDWNLQIKNCKEKKNTVEILLSIITFNVKWIEISK